MVLRIALQNTFSQLSRPQPSSIPSIINYQSPELRSRATMSQQQDSDAKAHLKEHGWVRIPSVLTKDEAAHALCRLWEAKATVEAEGEETYLGFLDPNPSNIRVFYLMAVDKLFRDLISPPGHRHGEVGPGRQLPRFQLHGQHCAAGVPEHGAAFGPESCVSGSVAGYLGAQCHLVYD